MLCLLMLVPGWGGDAAGAAVPRDLRLNDIQLLGSHNSYKLPMAPARMAALEQTNPAAAEALDYGHVPLEEQLDLGLRVLEIDVFFDPGGHLFGRQHAGDAESAFPVLHVQSLDDRSHCPNLLRCLALLRTWSMTHPDHLPVFVSFNAKDDVIDRPGFVRPNPFAERAWTVMDQEIRDVLGERLLTPEQVFDGNRLVWPELDAARGRFVAILDERGEKLRQYAHRWRARAMFANLPEDAPGAAILIVNDPLAEFDRIRGLVRQGFIVRTRADADTREARAGSFERRDAALASGAQLISTDYYLPAHHFGTGYHVTMPGGGIGRCNPVRVREPCVLQAVELQRR